MNTRIPLKLAQALLDRQENEREELAKTIHNDIFPLLNVFKIKLNSRNNRLKKLLPEDDAESKQQLNDLNDILEALRQLYYGLYPSLLKRLGLTKSIVKLCNDLSVQYNSSIDVHYDLSIPEPVLSKETQLGIFKALAEIITYMVSTGDTLDCNIFLDYQKKELVAKAVGNYPDEITRNNQVRQQKSNTALNVILTRLLVLNASIDDGTDWKKFCKVNIPYKTDL